MSRRRVPPSCEFLCIAALACASVGCDLILSRGGSNFPAARLEGEVTLDGKPLQDGSIQFVPQDLKAPPTQASILQGRYVAPKVGLGKVMAILTVAPPARPAVIESNYVPPAVVIIPARYKNGLPIDVTGDKMDQDFAMSSRK